MTIPDAEYRFLADLIRERPGLVLTPEKAYLLERRLVPVARKHGHDNLEVMVKAARAKPSEALFNDITEAMTTNESFFSATPSRSICSEKPFCPRSWRNAPTKSTCGFGVRRRQPVRSRIRSR